MIGNVTALTSIEEILQKEQFAYRTKLLIGIAIFFIAGLSFGMSFSLGKTTHAATDSVTQIHALGSTPESETIEWRGPEQGIYYGLTTNYESAGIAESTSSQNNNTEPFMRIQLSKLRAGTTYHFRIGLNGIDHSFQTISYKR